jgi:hypothetical protein
MILLVIGSLFSFLFLPVTGATRGAEKDAASSKTDKPEPKGEKKSRNSKQKSAPEAIPGYTIHKIQGFNVIINNDVLSQDVSQFRRKPLEVLDLELSTIVTLLPADAVQVLRRLLIWVEWDEKVVMSNGRAGTAEAIYYVGHQ